MLDYLTTVKKLKVASKDRIQRLKDDTRANILEASIDIVKGEGWQALSMRKIAEKIEYTAPIIYEYFANKEAILNELDTPGLCKTERSDGGSQEQIHRSGRTTGSNVAGILEFRLCRKRNVPGDVWCGGELLRYAKCLPGNSGPDEYVVG